MSEFENLSPNQGYKRQVMEYERYESKYDIELQQIHGPFIRNAQRGGTRRRQDYCRNIQGYIQYLRGEDCIDLIGDHHRSNLDNRGSFYRNGNGNIRRRAFIRDCLDSPRVYQAIKDRFEGLITYGATRQPPRTEALNWLYRFPYLNPRPPETQRQPSDIPQTAITEIHNIIRRITSRISVGGGRTLWDDVRVFQDVSRQNSRRSQALIASALQKLRDALINAAQDRHLREEIFSTDDYRAGGSTTDRRNQVDDWAAVILSYLRALNNLRRGGRAVSRYMNNAPTSSQIMDLGISQMMRSGEEAWNRLSAEERAVLMTEEGWNALVNGILPEMENQMILGAQEFNPDMGIEHVRRHARNRQEFLFNEPLPRYEE